MNCGGQVSAADSGLNAVSTIHSTGMKKAMPTTQPSTVQPAWPVSSRARRLARRSVTGAARRRRCRYRGHFASSNWKTLANSRSAKLATMIVSTTVTTPAAAAPPMSKAKFTFWYR